MKLAAIAATWGAFLMHEASCPTVEFDWNQHGYIQYDQEVDTKEQAEAELREATGSTNSPTVFAKRMIWHHCTPWYPKRY